MLVRMKQRIGGFRDGELWPAVGETIELPDHEAADMIANNYCEEVTNAAKSKGSKGSAAAGSNPDPAGESNDPASGEPLKPKAKKSAKKSTKKPAKTK